MKMEVIFILLLLGFCFYNPKAYDIGKSDIMVNTKGSEIIITIPYVPEVSSIFLSTEYGDECSSDYFYGYNLNKSDTFSFKIQSKREEKINEIVRIKSVIESKDQILTKEYDFKIDENGKGVKLDSPEIINKNDIYCTERNSKTESQFNKNLKCFQEEADSSNNLRCSGSLIFEENFESDKLLQWNFAVFSRVHTDHAEFTEFVRNNETYFLKDNKLHIVANKTNYKKTDTFKLNGCTYYKKPNKMRKCGPYNFAFNQPLPPLRSALLSSKYAFKYGRIEIRAKMPIGDWLFPYLLLQPNDTEVELDVKSNPHIRIAYARGNRELFDNAFNDIGGNVLFGSVFTSMDGHFREYMRETSLKSGSHYGDEFHNYTLIWHKNRLIFKVDGNTYGKIIDKRVLENINRTKHRIVLGLTAGGILNFREEYVNYSNIKFNIASPQATSHFLENLLKSSVWDPELIIDYVRVYTTHPDEN